VKMYGDSSEASTADASALEELSDEQKKLTFHHKPLYKKAAIVAAGPVFNFILTIGVFTYFIMTTGLPSVEPIVGEVIEHSAAADAGLKPGDRVLMVNDKVVKRFNDVPYYIATNLGTAINLTLQRGQETLHVTVTPRMVEDVDALGNKISRPLIGIKNKEVKYEEVGLGRALVEATERTYVICETTLEVLGQIISGKRSANELKGPLGIAQLSSQATQKDFSTTLWLIAMLSANLGLVNLLPVPMLDGGHLAFYTAEALRGRPLAEKVQNWSYRVGTALILMLMAFTILNDIKHVLL
jgi:regulator of sigma E protease